MTASPLPHLTLFVDEEVGMDTKPSRPPYYQGRAAIKRRLAKLVQWGFTNLPARVGKINHQMAVSNNKNSRTKFIETKMT